MQLIYFCCFSTYHQDAQGQVFVFFSMVIACRKGLAILVSIFRNLGSIDINKLKLKG
jgi:NADH-quinone oxidoreductase subunit K